MATYRICSLCKGTRLMGKAFQVSPPRDVTIPLPNPLAWHPPGIRNPATESTVACLHGVTCERCKGSGQEPA
jgi:hypothetical protein